MAIGPLAERQVAVAASPHRGVPAGLQETEREGGGIATRRPPDFLGPVSSGCVPDFPRGVAVKKRDGRKGPPPGAGPHSTRGLLAKAL